MNAIVEHCERDHLASLDRTSRESPGRQRGVLDLTAAHRWSLMVVGDSGSAVDHLGLTDSPPGRRHALCGADTTWTGQQQPFQASGCLGCAHRAVELGGITVRDTTGAWVSLRRFVARRTTASRHGR